MLAAAARVIPECLTLVGDAIKAALMDSGIDPKSKKGAGTASAKVTGTARAVLLKGAYTAARVALPGAFFVFGGMVGCWGMCVEGVVG